jgi:hypothetical protein
LEQNEVVVMRSRILPVVKEEAVVVEAWLRIPPKREQRMQKMATDDDMEKSVVVADHFVQTTTKTAANPVNNDQVSKIVPKL